MVSAVVVKGQQGCYCGGADLDWIAANQKRAPELFSALGELYRLIATYPKPLISVVNGDVNGGGLSLANSPYRVVTDSAQFSVPEAMLGLVPDGYVLSMLAKCDASSSLPVSNYLALSGVSIRSDDMMYLGLMTHQSPDESSADAIIRHVSSASYESNVMSGSALTDLLNMSCDWHTSAGIEKVSKDVLYLNGGEAFQNRKTLAPGPWTVDIRREIADCFTGNSVEDIWRKLEGRSSEWSKEALAGMQSSPALSLLATKRLIDLSASLDAKASAELSARVAVRLVAAEPFNDLIRRQGAPRSLTSLEDLRAVADGEIDALFAA
jgi:enoyl-CoA hydratase/carnithine racemase